MATSSGPNLATIQNRGPEAIVLNILDPNREVNPQYVNYLVVTKNGQTASGMIAGETRHQHHAPPRRGAE